MNETKLKTAFEKFLICRAGFLCGALSRREKNLAFSCFNDLCNDRRAERLQARSAEILEGLAVSVMERIAA